MDKKVIFGFDCFIVISDVHLLGSAKSTSSSRTRDINQFYLSLGLEFFMLANLIFLGRKVNSGRLNRFYLMVGLSGPDIIMRCFTAFYMCVLDTYLFFLYLPCNYIAVAIFQCAFGVKQMFKFVPSRDLIMNGQCTDT